jgi:hypothetical protein
MSKKKEHDPILIVLIINDRYVRWEEFLVTDTIKHVFQLLQDKYHIEKCIIEINDIFLSNDMNVNLVHICNNYNATIYVSTNDKNYKLCKSII